jgi:beta-glucosidase-like glycosyl hydrolase
MKNHATPPAGSAEIARRIAREGMVLLENNGALPLPQGARVAVFGVGQIDYIKTGSGSGSVDSEYAINLITGLRHNGKIQVDEELAAVYADYYQDYKRRHPAPDIPFPMEPPVSIPEMPLSEAIVAMAASNAKTAIVTFNRNSGEGSDRTLTKGDYYLTEAEEAMFAGVRAHFDKVIAVLNICGVMDMRWVANYKVDAVLLAWLAGTEGGHAMADILTGDVNPSGKLTDTFARDYWEYPSSYNFGSFIEGYETVVADGREIDYWGMMPYYKAPVKGTRYQRPIKNRYFVNYEEGIYVGYRYFETFDVKVSYPFGYGLSYTTFDIATAPITVAGDKITLKAAVKNTGRTPGREVVQVYHSAPDGKLEKPAKALVAYGKTDLIPPGASCTLTLSWPIRHMASYDEASAAWILEAGNYDIFVGNSVKNVKKAGTYQAASNVITEQLSNQLTLTPGTRLNTLSKRDPAGTFPGKPAVPAEPIAQMPDAMPRPENPETVTAGAEAKIKLADVSNGKAAMADFLAQMTETELLALVVGTGMLATRSIFGALSSVVPGAAGHTATLNRLGIPTLVLSDGPAGLRIEKPCTAFPMGTLAACTWDEDLIEAMGVAVGREAIEAGVDLWLAPGLNIHRNPLCGRNMEYYSEDPLVSGTMAAAVSRGVQSCGVGATCKHFAANNQETNRIGVDTVATERTLRELYLKGFEITVKSAAPWAIMTSFNAINGTYTAARQDLNIAVLRREWGFDGLVMTDWEGDGIYSVEAIKAEQNLLMPGGAKQIKYLAGKIREGALSRRDLERCVAGLLTVMMKTPSFARYAGMTKDGSPYRPPERWFTAAKSAGPG